jgi:hypothetical protein
MAKRKSTKGQTTIYKTNDQVTQTPLNTGGELSELFDIYEFFRDMLF